MKDKKLKRQIGYIPSSVIKPVEKKLTETKDTVTDIVELLKNEKKKAVKIVEWINSHKEFKWGGMCSELKIDRGNFQRILKSKSPSIKIEHVSKIESFLTKYGYAK